MRSFSCHVIKIWSFSTLYLYSSACKSHLPATVWNGVHNYLPREVLFSTVILWTATTFLVGSKHAPNMLTLATNNTTGVKKILIRVHKMMKVKFLTLLEYTANF